MHLTASRLYWQVLISFKCSIILLEIEFKTSHSWLARHILRIGEVLPEVIVSCRHPRRRRRRRSFLPPPLRLVLRKFWISWLWSVVRSGLVWKTGRHGYWAMKNGTVVLVVLRWFLLVGIIMLVDYSDYWPSDGQKPHRQHTLTLTPPFS